MGKSSSEGEDEGPEGKPREENNEAADENRMRVDENMADGEILETCWELR